MPVPTFPCPHCGSDLPVGTPACPTCSIRLTGPEAARLGQVNQQIAVLQAEAARLVAALLGPEPTTAPFPAPTTPPTPSLLPGPRGTARSPRSLSGQQVLLGLGAVMLLSAAVFFLAVVWLLVGLVGQAVIMGGLTALAGLGTAVATRHRLAAAAETGAVLAVGLLVIDLVAAHELGLAGLDRVAGDRYAALASALGALVVLGADRLVPRRREGEALRRVVTYRPAAAALVATTPWWLLAVADPDGVGLVAGFALVAGATLALALAAYRLDGARPATWVLLASAAVAVVAYAAQGLVIGYDHTVGRTDRYLTAALLALIPSVLALLSTRAGRFADRLRPGLPPAAVASGAVVLGIGAIDLAPGVLAALAVALAVPLSLVRGRTPRDPDPVRRSWAWSLLGAGYVVQPVVAVGVLALTDDRSPFVVPLLPLAAWTVTAATAAAARRSPAWLAVAEVALAALVLRGAWSAPAEVVVGVGLAVFGVHAVGAAVAARRTGRSRPDWRQVEAIALVAGTSHGAVALVVSVDASATTVAGTLVTLGVLTLGYAGSPRRLGWAYAGSLLVSAGTWTLMAERDVTTVEVYTAPLALLLAGIGALQWRRDSAAPTSLTMAPALSAALGPSLASTVTDGSALRLSLVTAVSVALLLVGLVRRWRAPVTAGAIALLVVAVTQGGPYVAYVPGWAILALGGAALLVAGVAWERAVVTGRRSAAWYAALH